MEENKCIIKHGCTEETKDVHINQLFQKFELISGDDRILLNYLNRHIETPHRQLFVFTNRIEILKRNFDMVGGALLVSDMSLLDVTKICSTWYISMLWSLSTDVT